MSEFYTFTVEKNDGQNQAISEYEGKVVLIVNTASKCGFTPQYESLQKLYEKYQAQGLEILAFPCNQFAGQEPGSDDEIAQFCGLKYNTTFPLFKKVDVNGDDTIPLYKFLKSEAPGIMGSKAIKWNFTKFLIGKDGSVVRRYAPNTKPEQMVDDIESALAQT